MNCLSTIIMEVQKSLKPHYLDCQAFPVFQLYQGLLAVQGHLFVQVLLVVLAGHYFPVFRLCQDLLEVQVIHSHQVYQDCQRGQYHPLVQVTQLDLQDLKVQQPLSNLEPQLPQWTLPALRGPASHSVLSDPVVQDPLTGLDYLSDPGNPVNL